MRKSILIGVSIVTILGILLAAVALGFADTKTRFYATLSMAILSAIYLFKRRYN